MSSKFMATGTIEKLVSGSSRSPVTISWKMTERKGLLRSAGRHSLVNITGPEFFEDVMGHFEKHHKDLRGKDGTFSKAKAKIKIIIDLE